MPTDVLPDIPAPPDAAELSAWMCPPTGCTLAKRQFTGTVREASGFAVRIAGVQRENRTCHRHVVVEAAALSARLEPEAVHQLAAMLTAAADEIEALR